MKHRFVRREDVEIIDRSLHFVNDLLRNMLDMHRVSKEQMLMNMKPPDVLHDILEPVDAILYRRCGTYEVQAECPDNLYIMTDRIRLKQIMLNLVRNSSKFVLKGFVRLSGCC